jgi:ribosomal protein S18 acetylase RimI-like enzyme
MTAVVRLREMTEQEYEPWRELQIETYSADIARASGVPADREKTLAEFGTLLPDGLATDGHDVFVVLDESGTRVGTIWLGPYPDRPNAAYVWDVRIDEASRGRGYGRAAMRAAEDLLRSRDIDEIGLNVFGFNERAQQLYTSLGYRVVSTRMTKTL